MSEKRELTPEELAREQMKLEIAEELGLLDQVKEKGWRALSAKDTGRIGGIMTRRMREQEKNKVLHVKQRN